MQTDETDRLVAATLAAAKASAANLTKPIEWILEYERMLKVLVRRKEQLSAESTPVSPADEIEEPSAATASGGSRGRKRKAHGESPSAE